MVIEQCTLSTVGCPYNVCVHAALYAVVVCMLFVVDDNSCYMRALLYVYIDTHLALPVRITIPLYSANFFNV